MSVDTPVELAVERPRARFLLELGWWLTIAVLTGVDAFGFYQNMALLLKDGSDVVVFLVVIGCTTASIVLPWRFGVAMSSRRQGGTGVLAVAFFAGLLWLGLAVAMFHLRLTTSPIGAGGGAGSGGFDDPLSSGNQAGAGFDINRLYVAVFLLIIYCVTGLMASKHAFDRTEERILRNLSRERRSLVDQLTEQREASAREADLLKEYEAETERLAEAQALEREVATAFAHLAHDEKFERLSRNLGEPEATEIMLDNYRRPGETFTE